MAMNRNYVILVPAFNCSATIAETLQSIQNQSDGLDRIRAVVLADDGSRDDTVTVAQRSWHCSVPLRVQRNPVNLGEYPNVNRAVAAMDADISWFFILHGDDIAKPNWLRVMIRTADSASPSVVSIDASWDMLKDGRITPGENRSEQEIVRVPAGYQSVQQWVVGGCWWKITSCCIRREVFLKLGGLDTSFRYSGDDEFIVRAVYSGFDVLHVPVSLSIYRVHDQSVTSNGLRKNYDLLATFRILQRFGPCLEPEQLRKAYSKRIRWAVHRFMHALAKAELRRSLSALILGIRIGVCYVGARVHSRADRMNARSFA